MNYTKFYTYEQFLSDVVNPITQARKMAKSFDSLDSINELFKQELYLINFWLGPIESESDKEEIQFQLKDYQDQGEILWSKPSFFPEIEKILKKTSEDYPLFIVNEEELYHMIESVSSQTLSYVDSSVDAVHRINVNLQKIFIKDLYSYLKKKFKDKL